HVPVPDNPGRPTVNKLRKLADKAEKAKRQPEQRPHPPQYTDDDNAELVRLQKRSVELSKRRLERDMAEWADVRASPTALRHLADILDEEISQRERERAQKKREAQGREAQEREARMWSLLTQPRQQNPLDVLNLPADATPGQINARYRALCKQLHP